MMMFDRTTGINVLWCYVAFLGDVSESGKNKEMHNSKKKNYSVAFKVCNSNQLIPLGFSKGNKGNK